MGTVQLNGEFELLQYYNIDTRPTAHRRVGDASSIIISAGARLRGLSTPFSSDRPPNRVKILFLVSTLSFLKDSKLLGSNFSLSAHHTWTPKRGQLRAQISPELVAWHREVKFLPVFHGTLILHVRLFNCSQCTCLLSILSSIFIQACRPPLVWGFSSPLMICFALQAVQSSTEHVSSSSPSERGGMTLLLSLRMDPFRSGRTRYAKPWCGTLACLPGAVTTR
jgi:hypothetical protein